MANSGTEQWKVKVGKRDRLRGRQKVEVDTGLELGRGMQNESGVDLR